MNHNASTIFTRLKQIHMQPTIQTITEKKLIGMSQTMSLVENKTFQLFSGFMPRKKEINGAINKEVPRSENFPRPLFFEF